MSIRILIATALVALAVPITAFAVGAKSSLHATMSGKAERPAGDPDGAGTAEIKINGRQVCWELTVRRIARPSAAHIHRGRAGVSGAVVVPLGGTFRAKGCANTSAANARAIAARPGNFYVNVHNARYPNGAVRGQLRRQ
ncbi:MAG TPA: CHRD domain-containing protein [Gaiellaceae bacterium]|nr:CHRD domain-containing protein [Gaiellaceae bacterium]